MLKKTEVSLDNNYGIEKIDSLPYNKPIILGIVPGGNRQAMNGYLNSFMYLLQIRKSPNVNSDYDIANIPFDILISENQDKIDEQINNLIPSNDINSAKHLMRNINIISYCAGSYDTSRYLKGIFSLLMKKGYTEKETKEILSQIFVLQVVDNYTENMNFSSIPYASVVTVHDVFDMENETYKYEEENESTFIHNPFVKILKNEQNDRYVLYKSFGDGSLFQTQEEHRFDHDYIHAPILNILMGIYLIKAISMSLNGIFINNNLSITHELNYILAKTQQFVMKKNKDFANFTKEELGELDTYLMNEIKTIFKDNISIDTLSKEEQDYLNEREEILRKLRTLDIDYALEDITTIINIIYSYYDNYSDNDIVYSVYNNSGVKTDFKKQRAIQNKIKILFDNINKLLEILNNIDLTNGISIKVQKDLNNEIKGILNKINTLINDDKIHQIFNEYCVEEKIDFSL